MRGFERNGDISTVIIGAEILGQFWVKRMSPDEVVDFIDALEGEVNNGGFHQYFYNSAGDNTAETIQALEIIGASKMANVVRRAAEKFPGAMPPKNRFQRQDVLLESDPTATAFRDLDEEFYDYPDNLAELLKKYRSSFPTGR